MEREGDLIKTRRHMNTTMGLLVTVVLTVSAYFVLGWIMAIVAIIATGTLTITEHKIYLNFKQNTPFMVIVLNVLATLAVMAIIAYGSLVLAISSAS